MIRRYKTTHGLLGLCFASCAAFSATPTHATENSRLIFLDRRLLAYEVDPPVACNDDETLIAFGNGIINNFLRAAESRQVMDEEFDQFLIDTGQRATFGPWRTALAFNETSTGIDTATAGNLETFIAFARDYIAKVAGDSLRVNTAQLYEDLSTSDGVSQEIRDQFQELSAAYDKSAAEASPAASRHVPGYEEILSLGRRTVIMGHSHGTLVANLAYRGVEDSLRDGLGITLAAAMDSQVEGASRFFGSQLPYVTIEEDNIARLYDILHDGSDWNVDEFPDLGPFSKLAGGHSFNTYYLGRQPDDITFTQQFNRTGDARRELFDWVVRYRAELRGRPCHGVTYTEADGQTAGYLGYSSTGRWWPYDGQTAVPLSQNSGDNTSETAFVDWRGRYEQGEATVVLSWQGPANRYLGRNYQLGTAIYRDGRIAYRAPSSVIGAAIQRAPSGEDFVVAATTSNDFTTTIVYRKRASENRQDQSLFDPSTGRGWREIGRYSQPRNSYYAPWYFNGDGTKATTLRVETRDLSFSRRPVYQFCDIDFGKLCVPGIDGYEAPYPAGDYPVQVLRRYELSVPASETASATLLAHGFETGDSGLLATDYLDDELLVLREVNIEPALGAAGRVDELASAGRWLTINDVDLTTADVIDCSVGPSVCRPTSSVGFGANYGGFYRQLKEGDYVINVLSLDLRTSSMFYSVLAEGDASYRLLHAGIVRELASVPNAETNDVSVYRGSRYGYEASYANRADVSIYYDEVLQTTIENPPKINPNLGQYELWPTIYAVRAARPPGEFAMVTTPNGATVVSAEFEDGSIANFHSEAPAQRFDYLVGEDLGASTLLPLMVQ